MTNDLQMIAPVAFEDFSKFESAAFASFCLSFIDTKLTWLSGMRGSDALPTRVIFGEIGNTEVAIDVGHALQLYARGLTTPPSEKLLELTKSAVNEAQKVKEKHGKFDPEHWVHFALNTEHYYYHIPLHLALSCLEAVRLNSFTSMTCILSTLRTSAFYRCHGDPRGADIMEIQDIMMETLPLFRRAFLYITETRQSRLSESGGVFPFQFLEAMLRYKNDLLLDNLLVNINGVILDKGITISQESIMRKREIAVTESQTTFRFRVFISFKNLDSSGRPTTDSSLAEWLYQKLTSKNLEVFFSNLSLEKLGQSAYSKAIDDALDSSQILIVVGTDPGYLESNWVRYEWDSFFNDIISGIKPNGRLFVYIDGLQTQSLPRKLRQAQVFHHERNEIESLCNFIENALI